MADGYQNLKDLTEVDSIVNGDKIVVETQNQGTALIDFQNLIIGLQNTTFEQTISANSTDVAYVSAYIDTTLETNIETLSTNINSLSTTTLALCSNSVNVTTLSTFYQATGVYQTLSDDYIINWDVSKGGVAGLYINGTGRTIYFQNILPGQKYTLILKYGADSYEPSFESRVRWPNNSPQLSSFAYHADILEFITDGSRIYGKNTQYYLY